MANKPKLLIIGHGRHGKDTVAQMIADKMGLTFSSSSDFVGRKAIWPTWGKERYKNYDAMFEDRVNFRKTWGDLIEAYCTPDASRTGREMLEEGNDMYIGMRRIREYNSCMTDKLFDHVIWVDACKRLPLEGKNSNEMESRHANLLIDNNGPESNLIIAVDNLQEMLHKEGFDVGMSLTAGYATQPPVLILGDGNQFKSQIRDVLELDNPIPDPNGVQPEEMPTKGDRLEWTDKPVNAIQVLDHGFFEVKEVMGTDSAIAESARMSYGRGTKKVNNDGGLINYLVHNYHTSPLEMGEIRFHMRLPIFVMRQLVRHRTANLNEYSGRYSEMVRLFYTPELSKIMCQGTVNKQMSGEPLPAESAIIAQNVIEDSSNRSFDDYETLLNQDVSRETARIVLPLNTYTECVWKLDVSNLIKFLYLRDDDHAQWEIRVYAIKIAEAVEHFFPLVYAAYMRERNSTSLTQDQIIAIIDRNLSGLAKGEAAIVRELFLSQDINIDDFN